MVSTNSGVLAPIERHWRPFEQRAPDFDYVATLRQICSEHSPPLPTTTMMEAIFDEPSFDFIAYLGDANASWEATPKLQEPTYK